MSRKTVSTVIYPLVAALIWGTAFVSQRISSGHIDAFAFNGARSIVGAVVLGLIILLRRTVYGPVERKEGEGRKLLIGGGLCGLCLAAAANLQQLGIVDTSAGKAGFITSLYIVLVPVLGLFVGKRISLRLWASVAIAVGGLYLLCVQGDIRLSASDFLILLCAVMFAVHILTVDHFIGWVNATELSFVQFLVAGIISWIISFAVEHTTWQQVVSCLGQILYVGVFSSGVAYTLQIMAQKEGNPVTVSLLFSLESVFSVLAGAVFLREILSGRESLGCLVMLCAVVLAQLPDGIFRKKTQV